MMNIAYCRPNLFKGLMQAKSFQAAVGCENSAGPRVAVGNVAEQGSSIIYYWFVSDEVILMLFAFPKNEQADLTPDQLKQLKKLVEGELK